MPVLLSVYYHITKIGGKKYFLVQVIDLPNILVVINYVIPVTHIWIQHEGTMLLASKC